MELESILIGVGIGFIGGSIMTCLMLRSTKKGVNDLIKRVIENPDKWKDPELIAMYRKQGLNV